MAMTIIALKVKQKYQNATYFYKEYSTCNYINKYIQNIHYAKIGCRTSQRLCVHIHTHRSITIRNVDIFVMFQPFSTFPLVHSKK